NSPDEHILIFEKDSGSPYALITVLVKKTPWTAPQREQAQQQATALGYRIRPYTPSASKPALDDSPFFFYTPEGRTVILESLAVLLVASVVLFLLAKPRQFAWHGSSFAFFGAIGTAYLLVENSFLQKFILLIRNPTLAVSTVFMAFLFFSGLG